MNNAKQKKILYLVLILGCLVLIYLVLFSNSDPMPVNPSQANKKAITQTTETTEVDSALNKKTIATAWQWEFEPSNDNAQKAETLNIDSNKNVDIVSSIPFTEESVYHALHAVKLDDNGDIIIDNDALTALNKTFGYDEVKLDDETLEKLQDLIKLGLPGNAGEQAAQIVADYYHFLGATHEFNALYETRDNPNRSIEDHEAQYNELLALREVYLGSKVADQLFATDNANAQYMFESIKLEANTSLNEEEKKQEQAKIIERHAEKTINVNNWNVRYRDFSEEKKYIINSSISAEEKRDQLTSLMRQHFSYEELNYVKHLQLDSL
jgi:lipase chaperone LimK